jgi:hypothetical protein
MSDTMLALVAVEARSALDGHVGDLRSAAVKAMRACHNHWMVLEQEAQFRGALVGLMQHYGPESEEYKRLSWEIGQIRKLDAMIVAGAAGLSVNLEGLVDDEKPPYEPLGLIGIWRETA